MGDLVVKCPLLELLRSLLAQLRSDSDLSSPLVEPDRESAWDLLLGVRVSSACVLTLLWGSFSSPDSINIRTSAKSMPHPQWTIMLHFFVLKKTEFKVYLWRKQGGRWEGFAENWCISHSTSTVAQSSSSAPGSALHPQALHYWNSTAITKKW